MHVVILGAGTVGTSIAEILCSHGHNVCIVEGQQKVLDRVEESLDVQTVLGSACEAIPLFQAGVLNADICLAVTSRDEINLVGASLAKAMGAKQTVARIFNPAYRDYSTFDYQRHFNIDRIMSLEKLTALELAKGIQAPGLFAVENFARGGVQILEVGVDERSRSVGKTVRELGLPRTVRIGLIAKDNVASVPAADDRIEPGQQITLIGKQESLDGIKRQFQARSQQVTSIVIAGGGEIGMNLARLLDSKRYRLTMLEEDPERCRALSVRLSSATVLCADATMKSELEEARVGSVDVFIAAMGRDEDNIICGVEARELGAKRILGIVRRPDYANVLERLGIDLAVSPREVMAREILGMLSTGPIIRRSPLAGGAAEVWEVQIKKGAKCTGAALKDLHIQDCLIAAIMREEYVDVATGDDELRPKDTVVVLVKAEMAEHALAWFTPPPKRKKK